MQCPICFAIAKATVNFKPVALPRHFAKQLHFVGIIYDARLDKEHTPHCSPLRGRSHGRRIAVCGPSHLQVGCSRHDDAALHDVVGDERGEWTSNWRVECGASIQVNALS
eukprot:scaffold281896_cov34-Tisochrysis_lutea.AAC.3